MFIAGTRQFALPAIAAIVAGLRLFRTGGVLRRPDDIVHRLTYQSMQQNATPSIGERRS